MTTAPPPSPDGDTSKNSGLGGKAALFVIVTVFIDSMGIGVIIPVTPGLLSELSDLPVSQAAFWGGYLTFSYAVMQFAFSPMIGNLSDRFGRRPVLLASLAALAVDYVVMGLAPTLWVLFISRIIAGIAAATYATANAYIADVSAPEKRAANFGLIGMGFGLGFTIGPAIGGFAGEFGTRVPFFVAAALAALNFAYGWFVLPESLPPEKRRPFVLARANPFGALRQIRKVPMVAWFILVAFLYEVATYVYPAVWSFYTIEAFDWTPAQVGASLTAVGIGFAIVQGGLIRIILKRLGEVKTASLGFVTAIAAFLCLAFATEGWMIYALIPIVALGNITTPALSGLMANRTPDNAQGELQGALSSVKAVAVILSPVLMTQLFGRFTGEGTPVYFPGAPFLAAAALTALAAVPFVIGLKSAPPRTD